MHSSVFLSQREVGAEERSWSATGQRQARCVCKQTAKYMRLRGSTSVLPSDRLLARAVSGQGISFALGASLDGASALGPGWPVAWCRRLVLVAGDWVSNHIAVSLENNLMGACTCQLRGSKKKKCQGSVQKCAHQVSEWSYSLMG